VPDLLTGYLRQEFQLATCNQGREYHHIFSCKKKKKVTRGLVQKCYDCSSSGQGTNVFIFGTPFLALFSIFKVASWPKLSVEAQAISAAFQGDKKT
jgi:hypothetical protein